MTYWYSRAEEMKAKISDQMSILLKMKYKDNEKDK